MIGDIVERAVHLILNGDRELFGIIALSLQVSGSALIISSVLAIPLATIIGLSKFHLNSFLVNVMNTFMGLPPVVVGLILYILLSRNGVLGFLGLLYTPTAMIIAQSILAFPIVVSLCHTAIVGIDPVIKQAAEALGATRFQTALLVIREARYGILSAIIAALGRLMSEVGAILIVGGNIAGYTRVMTTTIAMEADKGNFEMAVALGLILLLISMVINLLLQRVQTKKMKSTAL